jgi:hypothetical protein
MQVGHSAIASRPQPPTRRKKGDEEEKGTGVGSRENRELIAKRTIAYQGRSFGDNKRTEEMAEKHGVWFTLRPSGRPPKKKKTTLP